MGLAFADWLIVSIYVIFAIGTGLFLKKRASENLDEFFVSGRKFPWWVVGTSMVATTFSIDTPLAVTGLVGTYGIAGNWLTWTLLMSGMVATFFFAKLWRRSGLLTDVEFIELRYSGKSAAFLRGFLALFRGALINCLVMGWVVLALGKVASTIFTYDPKYQPLVLAIPLAVVAIYCVLSGFWGVVATDLFQFCLAFGGAIIFAVLALNEVGGMTALKLKLVEQFGADKVDSLLSFLPAGGPQPLMPVAALFAFLGVMWWMDPNVEGGSYIAQRMLAAKNEKHAAGASLWFNLTNYAIIPWPWITVALVSLVVYPNLADRELGYPKLLIALVPAGLKGLMITSLLAAFMSTMDTHVNWGASYLMNDFYKRFFKRNASSQHYVIVSKVIEMLLIVIALVFSLYMKTVFGVWEFLFSMTSGLGVVYICRWFWWRVNAWSEISAMISSFVVATILVIFFDLHSSYRILIVSSCTTVVWVVVTLLTKPVDEEVLIRFYKKVKPASRFWNPIRNKITNPKDKNSPDKIKRAFVNFVGGVVFIYCAQFGIGNMVLQDYFSAAMLLTCSAIGALVIYRNFIKESS